MISQTKKFNRLWKKIWNKEILHTKFWCRQTLSDTLHAWNTQQRKISATN